MCRLRIFDFEEEKCFDDNILLRIITSLEGISQINIHNSLYLCGTNDDPSDSVGSYLLKIDLSVSPIQPLVLINSIFSHYYPSLINSKTNSLLLEVKIKFNVSAIKYLIRN